MTGEDRKRFLQSIGALPPDQDQMGAMPEQPAPAPEDNGDVAPPEAPVESEDPKEKLRRLITPELFQRLRERAGGMGQQ